MISHSIIQGSDLWHEHRANYFNASDAPAMMDVSPYKTRAQLLHERATGIIPEVDAATQRRFDDGHRFEALARTLAEQIIGEELYPVVGSKDKLSASFDGITMIGDVIFEHKTLNKDIQRVANAKQLDPVYRIQMEQQLLVSGAEKCLFMASKWDENDNLIEEKHLWYEPNLSLREEIIDSWAQFQKDLAAYVPPEINEPPKAEPIKDLPMVTVQVKGELTLCNINDITPLFDKFLAEARTTLITDDDFAQAEAEAKVGRETAKRCKLTAKAVVDQMLSISEVTRTLEDYAAKFDAMALRQEKAVKEQKETRKTAAKLERDKAYADHIAALNAEIAPIRLELGQVDKPDFVGAMKGQRTLSSLYNKLDAELARAKIAADAMAKSVRLNLALINGQPSYRFLFNDAQQLVYKNFDDLKILIESRIDKHAKDEAERLEAERQRIRQEEEAKARREAEAKIRAEQEAERLRVQQDERLAKFKELALAEQERAGRQAEFEAEEARLFKLNEEAFASQQAPTVVPEIKQEEQPVSEPEWPVAVKLPSVPTDLEIIQVIAAHYRVPAATALEWVSWIDAADVARKIRGWKLL